MPLIDVIDSGITQSQQLLRCGMKAAPGLTDLLRGCFKDTIDHVWWSSIRTRGIDNYVVPASVNTFVILVSL